MLGCGGPLVDAGELRRIVPTTTELYHGICAQRAKLADCVAETGFRGRPGQAARWLQGRAKKA